MEHCDSCGRPGVEHCCSGCGKSAYCSVECQRRDWEEGAHATLCTIDTSYPDGPTRDGLKKVNFLGEWRGPRDRSRMAAWETFKREHGTFVDKFAGKDKYFGVVYDPQVRDIVPLEYLIFLRLPTTTPTPQQEPLARLAINWKITNAAEKVQNSLFLQQTPKETRPITLRSKIDLKTRAKKDTFVTLEKSEFSLMDLAKGLPETQLEGKVLGGYRNLVNTTFSPPTPSSTGRMYIRPKAKDKLVLAANADNKYDWYVEFNDKPDRLEFIQKAYRFANAIVYFLDSTKPRFLTQERSPSPTLNPVPSPVYSVLPPGTQQGGKDTSQTLPPPLPSSSPPALPPPPPPPLVTASTFPPPLKKNAALI
jgi:MYND finger